MFIAVLLLINFVTNAYEAQMYGKLENPDGSPTPSLILLDTMDLVFTMVFTAELLLNMHANLLGDFLNGWSLFDLTVVSISLFTFFSTNTNVPVNVFRLLRAFRVLRLFGRLKSIKKIINALGASLFPVMNAFAILGIVLLLFSIMGVTFFADRAPTDMGNLSRAFITLFRMACGETWLGDGDDPEDGLPVLRSDGKVHEFRGLVQMGFDVWGFSSDGLTVLRSDGKVHER